MFKFFKRKFLNIILIIMFTPIFDIISTQNVTQITRRNDTELWLRIVIDYKICENDTIVELISTRLIKKCAPLILTPFIESNRIEEAKKRSLVTDLPNAPNITSYSGYLTVNKQYNSNTFFWFFPSTNKSNPMVLLLAGGPGCSVMPLIFGGSGPYIVNSQLMLRIYKYSWTKHFSLLYIENPIGTGFSFTHNIKGFSTDISNVTLYLYNALQQFFSVFSDYRKSDFYIVGLSYAGKFIPALGYKIHELAGNSNINFKGIAIGNGWIDPINQLDLGSFLYQIGLIDDRQAKRFYEIQDQMAQQIEKQNYTKAYLLFEDLFGSINGSLSYFDNITGRVSCYNYLQCDSDCEHVWNYEMYLNQKETLEAIHVGCMRFASSNETVAEYLRDDIFKSVKPWFVALMDNYKVLIFSGLLDVIVANPLTVNFINKLNWKYSKEFASTERLVWKLDDNDNEVTGYVKRVVNFTLVTFRNAGHSTLYEHPRAVRNMIDNFINSKQFNTISTNKSIDFN